MTTAAEHIDERIRTLADWRGRMLAHIRRLIHAADPAIAFNSGQAKRKK